MKNSNPLLRLASLVMPFCLALVTSLAHAGTVYSTGFENPPFELGSLAGQDGWEFFGADNAQVEDTVVWAGSQAVSVDGSAAVQSGPWHNDSSTSATVELSASLYLGRSSSESTWQFVGIGPMLLPNIGNNLIGGIREDAGTNEIHLITAGFPVVGTLTRDLWHNVDLVFDFTNQTYSFKLDGALLGSNVPFCGDTTLCEGERVGAYSVGSFETDGGGSDFGYLDNYSVRSSSVPEPSSLWLLGLGLVGTVGALRRSLSLSPAA